MTNCKSSRSSGQLSAGILYISKSVSKDPCVTKTCAVAGSLNNTFSSLETAQAFYLTQPGAQTAANPVTYTFVDNGEFGTDDSMFILSVFENLVGSPKGPTLRGHVEYLATNDGTQPGIVGLTISGINFVNKDTTNTTPLLAFHNSNPFLQLYAVISNPSIIASSQRPLLSSQVEPGDADSTKGVVSLVGSKGSTTFVSFVTGVLTNTGSMDLLTMVGEDREANVGTNIQVNASGFLWTAFGNGSITKLYSPFGYEKYLFFSDNSSLFTSYAANRPIVHVHNAFTSGRSGVVPSLLPNLQVNILGKMIMVGLGSVVASKTGGGATTQHTLEGSITAAPLAGADAAVAAETNESGSEQWVLIGSRLTAAEKILSMEFNSNGISAINISNFFLVQTILTDASAISIQCLKGTLAMGLNNVNGSFAQKTGVSALNYIVNNTMTEKFFNNTFSQRDAGDLFSYGLTGTPQFKSSRVGNTYTALQGTILKVDASGVDIPSGDVMTLGDSTAVVELAEDAADTVGNAIVQIVGTVSMNTATVAAAQGLPKTSYIASNLQATGTPVVKTAKATDATDASHLFSFTNAVSVVLNTLNVKTQGATGAIKFQDITNRGSLRVSNSTLQHTVSDALGGDTPTVLLEGANANLRTSSLSKITSGIVGDAYPFVVARKSSIVDIASSDLASNGTTPTVTVGSEDIEPVDSTRVSVNQVQGASSAEASFMMIHPNSVGAVNSLRVNENSNSLVIQGQGILQLGQNLWNLANEQAVDPQLAIVNAGSTYGVGI